MIPIQLRPDFPQQQPINNRSQAKTHIFRTRNRLREEVHRHTILPTLLLAAPSLQDQLLRRQARLRKEAQSQGGSRGREDPVRGEEKRADQTDSGQEERVSGTDEGAREAGLMINLY